MEVWGKPDKMYIGDNLEENAIRMEKENIIYYRYTRGQYPHVGCGKFVHF